jgi:UDP-N-acetyl-D-glucosamine dehydrogenase
MTPPQVDALIARFQARQVRIGVVGLGYVGLPLVRAVAEHGFTTLGFDVDPAKIDILNGGGSYIRHIAGETIAKLRNTGRFEATADFSRIAEADALLLCVPTPLTRQREPDLTYVVSTTETIASRLRPGHLIVLESTTYPGTTREVMRPIL